MNDCTDCIHAKFDKLWGEYKCKAFCHVIHILLSASECPQYKKATEKAEVPKSKGE